MSQAHAIIKELRAIRRTQEISQREVSERSGHGAESISDMEMLRHMPRLGMVADIAEVLGYRLTLTPMRESAE